MAKANSDSFVFGIDGTMARDLIGGDLGNNKFVFYSDPSTFTKVCREMGKFVLGGIKGVLDGYHPGIRQFVGYGLRYHVSGNVVRFATHLKTKTHSSSGEITGRLSLGVGEHLDLELYNQVVNHTIIPALDKTIEASLEEMARGTIRDSLFTPMAHLVKVGQNYKAASLGFVMATDEDKGHKTNRHIGLVMAEQIKGVHPDTPPEYRAREPGEHFVGWLTAAELMRLQSPGANTIVYRHEGFEPWAGLIVNELSNVSQFLLDLEAPKEVE